MRNYEFRCKRIDNIEWVYGYYLYDIGKDIHYIQTNIIGCSNAGFKHKNTDLIMEFIEVDPSTIGQFTGLVDKNGKRIYEGDIIKGKEWERGTSHRHIGIVEYINSSFRSVGINKYLGFHGSVDGSYEVIGNIHTKENK